VGEPLRRTLSLGVWERTPTPLRTLTRTLSVSGGGTTSPYAVSSGYPPPPSRRPSAPTGPSVSSATLAGLSHPAGTKYASRAKLCPPDRSGPPNRRCVMYRNTTSTTLFCSVDPHASAAPSRDKHASQPSLRDTSAPRPHAQCMARRRSVCWIKSSCGSPMSYFFLRASTASDWARRRRQRAWWADRSHSARTLRQSRTTGRPRLATSTPGARGSTTSSSAAGLDPAPPAPASPGASLAVAVAAAAAAAADAAAVASRYVRHCRRTMLCVCV
jgi:hypothetical protein